jgi:hypothetical protein
MQSILGFFGTIIQLAFFLLILVAVIAFFGYNKLRGLSENIREAWSNIGVVGKKQVSLINQLIDVVKGYQESEKLVMLKVSEDVSTANAVASMQHQSGLVMTSVSSLAQKFPELKANDQYMRLIDSIQKCEEQLESARQAYNAMVKQYNTHRSSIPHVFYANALKFHKAPYLEFQGNEQVTDMGSMKNFSADDDGERLNALLGAAGNSALKLGSRAINNSVDIANKAIEGSKVLVDAAQEKVRQRNSATLPVSDIQTLADSGAKLPPIPQDLPQVLFHYLDANKTPTGPVNASELRTLITSGAITLTTLVAATGATEWITAELALSSAT